MVKFATLASLAGTIVSTRAAAATVPFDGLTNTQIRNVRSRLLESSKASWEIGTAVQALLELDTPSHGVFGKATIPPPARLNNTSEVLRYAGRIVDSKVSDSMTLMVDGAAGDPASIGVAVLLANFTEGTHTKKYAEAAQSQLHWLLDVVPRAANGAISHRNEQNQNWADFVSMVPPFLAYFGAITQDRGLLQQGYDQVRLYRDILRVTDGDFTGTVHHVINGDWSDPGIWATGQGWFAYGAIRVAQTLKLSSFSGSFKKEQADLLAWADEIITATYKHVNDDGSFNNYLDQSNQFQEMASTALVAASTFRLATITGKPNNIEAATKAFRLVKDKIDEDGWLQNVVNPYNFHDPGEHSPESQAFTLQLQAAWSEYKASIAPLPSIANVANVGNVANVASEPTSERPNLGAVAAGTYSIPKSSLGMRKRSARHMRNMAASFGH